MNPLTSIPSLYRQRLYIAYGVFALVVGALAVAYADPDPAWVDALENVVQYLAIPFGALAASNVTSADGPPPVPANDPPANH